MALEDFAPVVIIALFLVARQRPNTNEIIINVY